MRIVVPPGGRRRWNRAGPGRSTDRTKVTGVVAPVGRAYLDLALSLSVFLSPLLSSPLHFTSLLSFNVYTHTQHTTHTSRTVHSSVPFRSVPFRTVRSYRTNVSCAVSLPTPRLTSLRLASRRLASSLSSAYPIPSLARSLSWLRQPRYALLPQTQPRFNPDFVSNKRWIRWVYTPGCTRKVISSLFLLCDARRNEHFSRNAHAFRLGSANGQLATLV